VYSEAIGLGGDFVHPQDIVKYSTSQYKNETFLYTEFNLGHKYGWLKIKSLTKNKFVYILADHVLFPYSHRHQYTKSTSSGAAAHSKQEKVLTHAVFEIIERDAFMIYWLNKLEMPIIDNQSVPRCLYSRILKLQNLGYILIIRNIGLDIAPVIFISVKNSHGNYVTCGMASGSNAENMIESALSEVEISILHLLNIGTVESKFIDTKDVHSLQQHEDLHQQTRYKSETEFFFKKGNIIAFDEFSLDVNSVRDICVKLEKLGFEILELDASNWEINILLPEFRFVSKVIVPGLVPLSYGYVNEPLGMSRIYDIPGILKLKKNDLDINEINRFPHPFN